MSEENGYTLKEVVETNFKEMREHLQEIKIQTIKTNGRVNSLEKTRVQVWTAIGVLMFIGSAVITLSIMAIDNKIDKSVQRAISSLNLEK